MDSLKALWGKLRGEKKEDKEDDKKKKKDKGEKKEEKEVKSGKKEEKGKEGKEEKKEKKSPSDKKEKKEKKEKEEKKEKKNHEESDAKEKKKKEKKVDETGETKTKEVKIPNEYHKYIVGTKGAVIQELEKKTGARIQVPRAEDDSDIITLEGTASQYDLEKETAETEKLYQKYQKEVDKQAELRGKYFEESKKAYEDGDKAKAKELSDKGHHHSHLMEEAQKKASKEIFKAKNKKYKDNLTIDLHGLHKEDALQFLEERLELVKNEKGKQLCVIYGAGIHSNEGGPVIKPAVEELIKKRGLETEEQSHGSVLVNIK